MWLDKEVPWQRTNLYVHSTNRRNDTVGLACEIIDEWIKQANEKHKGLNAKAVLDEFHAELKKLSAGK